MTRDCFNLLCQKIIDTTGESNFKYQSFISVFLRVKDRVYDATTLTTGGYISEELKPTITLHILGDGDVLDIGVIFDIHSDQCARLMYDVLLNWIIYPNIGNSGMSKYLLDEKAIVNVSKRFSARSGGVIEGSIGTLDGWVLYILRPDLKDSIQNTMSFFSRKSFYSLNVQWVVDDKKREIWASYSHKGDSYDLSCFKETTLHEIIEPYQDIIYQFF